MRAIELEDRRRAPWRGTALAVVAATLASLIVAVVKPPAAVAQSAPSASSQPSGVSPSPNSAPGFDSKTSIPIDAETTPTKRVFANTDGTRTAQITNVPVRFKGTDNAWHDVDNTLVSNADGTLSPASAARPSRVAPRSSGAVISQPTSAGPFSLSHPDATAASDSASANMARYSRGLSNNRDLTVAVTTTGFEETVTLPDAKAANSYAEQFTVPAGITARNGGAGIEFVDGSGAVVAGYGGGVAVDSSGRAGTGAMTPAVVSLVGQQAQTVKVAVTVDPSFLTDPARVFPIDVDPTFYQNDSANGSGAFDGYVDGDYPTSTVGWSSNDLHIGYSGTAAQHGSWGRSFLWFNLGSLVNSHYLVSNAHLSMFNEISWSCTPADVYLYGTASPFSYSTTWNTQPNVDGFTPTHASFAHGYSGCPGAWESVDATALTQRWFNGSQANNGMEIQGSYGGSGTNVYGWKEFYSGEAGSNSAPAFSITYAVPPSAPQNVVATRGNGQATVTWSPPADNGGSAITKYTIKTFNASNTLVRQVDCNAPCSTSTTTGLVNGTSYYFIVSAWNAVNFGPGAQSSSVVPATVPNAPQNVAVTASGTTATVTWTAPGSNGGTPVDSYLVQPWDTVSGALTPTTVCATCLSTSFAGLAKGHSYFFNANAHNAVGYSSAATSNTVAIATTVPGAPTALNAGPAYASANLSWTPPADNGGTAITGYSFVVTDTSKSLTTTTSCNGSCVSTNTFSVLALIPGDTYQFTVAAINGVSTGPASNSSNSIVIQPTATLAPTNVAATRGDRQASVSWTNPTLAVNGLTTYTVYTYRASDSTRLGSATPTTASSATIAGLKNGTPVYFTVTSTNAVVTSPESTPSNTVTPAGRPFPPANVNAIRGDQQATVSWSAPPAQADGTPGNNGDAITGWTVRVYSGGALVREDPPVGAAVFQSPEPGLTNGTSYTFTVKATNGLGISDESAASSPVVPAGRPFPPVGVTATANPGHQATVSWQAPPTQTGGVPGDNGSQILSYTVTATPGGLQATTSGTPAPTSVAVTGLADGTPYTFTVQATNIVGTSDASAPSNSVTPVDPPSVPTGVTAVAANTSATVSWTASTANGAPVTYTVTATPGGRTATTTGTTTEVTGLTNYTQYTFTVQGTNSAGSSANSTPSNAVTPYDPQGPGQNLTIARATDQQVAQFEQQLSGSGVTSGQYTDDQLQSFMQRGDVISWLFEHKILPLVATFDNPCTGPNGIGTVPCHDVEQYGYDFKAIFDHEMPFVVLVASGAAIIIPIAGEVLDGIILSSEAVAFWEADQEFLELDPVVADDIGTIVQKNEAMSVRAQGYQAQISGQPVGTVYRVVGPNGVPVDFDGYNASTGGLLDAKGLGYDWAVQNGQFRSGYEGAQQLVAQAQRQLAAAPGRVIEWHIASSTTLTAIQNLLSANGINGITLVYTPPTG